MKKLFLLAVTVCLIVSCSTLKTPKSNPYYFTYLDEKGESLTSQEYQIRWRDKTNNLVRWDYISDTGRVAILKEPLYSQYMATYPTLLKKLEAKTGRTFSPSTIFLLDYTYLNDLCSDKSTNNWNKAVIKSRKEFTTPNKEQIEAEHKNVVMLKFFEQGIILENEPTSAEEYYFTDDNFLRKNFFKHTSFCGSFALIKPDGTTLVRNGEYTAKMMVEHLQPAIWEKIFTEKESG